MSNSISSIGSQVSAMMGMQRSQRTDSTKLAEQLFSQIDSSGKGYINQSDLEAAFEKVNSTSSTASADELFSSLDSDGDGKVTQEEMSSGLQNLMSALDSQFENMRMEQARGDVPPPPPPPSGTNGTDEGLTEDEMQSMISSVGSSDSNLTSMLQTVVANFDAADTNQDGKVTFAEAQAYANSQASSNSASTSSASSATAGSDSSTSTSSASDAQLMLQIMKLAEAYGLFGQARDASSLSALA